MDLRDRQGNTAFGKAAAAGPSEIIQMLMPMNNGQFPSTKGGGRMTPLYSAVLFGHSAVALALYNGNRQNLSDDEKKWLFFTCINNQIFDLALKLIHDYGILQLHCARDGTTSETALHVLARKPSAFASQGIWKRLINSSPCLGPLRHTCLRTQALDLLKEILRRVSTENWDVIRALTRTPYHITFKAAELGNYDFLVLVIQSFPELIWEQDNKHHTIFHVAILKRNLNIFKLIHGIGLCKLVIQYWEDDSGNNILHLASGLPTPDILNIVSGSALQMQRELLFFKEVEKIVSPTLRNKRNFDKRTPKELFSQQHKDLMQEGEKWMKKTSSSCLLVASLIATVVFSAAFTIPGGNDNSSNATSTVKGCKKTFIIVAIVNTIAMTSSTTSMIMFLSILTSGYAEKKFHSSLVFKFKFGLVSLLISMATTAASFCLVLIVYHIHLAPEGIHHLIFYSSMLLASVSILWSELHLLRTWAFR